MTSTSAWSVRISFAETNRGRVHEHALDAKDASTDGNATRPISTDVLVRNVRRFIMRERMRFGMRDYRRSLRERRTEFANR